MLGLRRERGEEEEGYGIWRGERKGKMNILHTHNNTHKSVQAEAASYIYA